MKIESKNEELFSDIIGQNYAIQILKSSLEKKQIAPAYIFQGPKGVGKKKTLLRFVEGILKEGHIDIKTRNRLASHNHPDLLWIEPTYISQGKLIASSIAKKENLTSRSKPQIRLEQIRELTKFLSNKPLESYINIIIIEDIDSINEAAANALLKTLEEPGQAIIFLIAERPEKLLSTITSRCRNVPFKRLNKDQINEVLNLNKQYINIDFTEISLMNINELYELANGSPGELIEHARIWKNLPESISNEIQKLPQDCLGCLSLAKLISEELNLEQQLWLINWLQQNNWKNYHNKSIIERLDKMRSQLLRFVQPRLAWEVALLEINSIKQ